MNRVEVRLVQFIDKAERDKGVIDPRVKCPGTIEDSR